MLETQASHSFRSGLTTLSRSFRLKDVRNHLSNGGGLRQLPHSRFSQRRPCRCHHSHRQLNVRIRSEKSNLKLERSQGVKSPGLLDQRLPQ
jgi:hypothetical protein